jgi:hypothetical protein
MKLVIRPHAVRELLKRRDRGEGRINSDKRMKERKRERREKRERNIKGEYHF